MRDLLLKNLRQNQAFADVLRRGTAFDRYAAQYLNEIVFNRDARERKAAIGELSDKIVDYFGDVLASDARKVGFGNAARVLRVMQAEGYKLNIEDARTRKRIFNDLEARTEDRLRIMQRLVNDRANTLDNRLAAYWLEPGANEETKLQRLRDLHKQQEAARAEYEKKLANFLAGETDRRPRKPNVDFMAKFVEDVKQDNVEQARRVATDAETAAFTERGLTTLAWVTVNASEACPQCKERQGWSGNTKFWDGKGRPGSGQTYCKSACFCMLVPAETLTLSPSLAQDGLAG